MFLVEVILVLPCDVEEPELHGDHQQGEDEDVAEAVIDHDFTVEVAVPQFVVKDCSNNYEGFLGCDHGEDNHIEYDHTPLVFEM